MKENLIGKKFGYLTIIEDAGKTKKSERLWLCRCDCGNTKITRETRLKAGSCKSCGCYQKKKVAEANLKHGGSKSKLYRVWASMIQRCDNPKATVYKYYGAIGISVCDEWHDFSNFRRWSCENGYDENLTIDRIDVNGNYEPSNCRWVGFDVQSNNKRNSHYVTINGETKTISEWCQIYGINDSTVRSRLFYGWNEVDAITTRTN